MPAASKKLVLFDCLCQFTTAALPCDWSHVLLWQPKDAAYVPVSEYGATAQQWESIRLLQIPATDMAGFLAGFAHADAMPVDSQQLPTAALPLLYGTPRALCIALRHGSEVLGVLTAGHHQPAEPFTPQQEQIARGIAHLAALAAETAPPAVRRAHADLKSERMACASHELRTPLSVIMGYNDLLLDGAFGPITAEQSDILRRMDKSVRQSLDLVNTILDLTRREPEPHALAPEMHDRS